MPDIKDMLRRLADMYEQEEKGEASSRLEQRIDALEAQLSKQPQEKVEEAAEELELDDDELAAVREFIAERRAAQPVKDAKPKTEKKKDDKPRRTREGRKAGNLYRYTIDDDGKRVELDIPTIYSGEDEPDEVELPAEDESDAA